MGCNHVGVEGAKALSKVIEENKTLRELRLYGDHSLGEGADSLLASLQNNTTLQRLVLPLQYIVSPASRFFFLFFFLVKGEEEKKKRLETLARFSWAIGMQLPEFPPPFCDAC